MKILIVDDKPEVRSVLQQLLEDHNITEASNGKEALDLFKLQVYDVVISDIEMPVMDGIELLKSIKSIKPEQKVINMTANTNLTMQNIPGTHALLYKPFQFDELFKQLS